MMAFCCLEKKNRNSLNFMGNDIGFLSVFLRCLFLHVDVANLWLALSALFEVAQLESMQ